MTWSLHPPRRTRLPCVDVTEVNQGGISTPLDKRKKKAPLLPCPWESQALRSTLTSIQHHLAAKKLGPPANLSRTEKRSLTETSRGQRRHGMSALGLTCGQALHTQPCIEAWASKHNMQTCTASRSQMLMNMLKHVCIRMQTMEWNVHLSPRKTEELTPAYKEQAHTSRCTFVHKAWHAQTAA